MTHNPDVLCCLANLSNDEVFTPPQLANEVLDLLPKEIWNDPTITFLDPCCKTGVFLREITLRLIEGLKDEIPNLQERINHILTKQVFGIAITELTALITRRTLYCSKEANGKYSVCTEFGHSGGNIYYNRNIKHQWKNGPCEICGASQKEWDREELESHAYAFIHKPIEELFNMKFDVIIGNPPYQLNDGGHGASAMPLYHKFVQKAKELNPKYITMIIKANWYTTGRGLDKFRLEMLNDTRIKTIVDFPNSDDCFPGTNIEGGVCYFLWDKNYNGDCKVINKKNDINKSISIRPLKNDGISVFIRYNEAASILNKVSKLKEKNFSEIASPQKPFGLRTYFEGEDHSFDNSILVYGNKQRKFVSYTEKKNITKNQELIDTHKVLMSKAYGSGKEAPFKVLNNPILSYPGSCCTESYIILGTYNSEREANNAITYINTKFFRFLVLMKKPTQDAARNVYELVPLQDFSKPWTDAELYEKYGLTQDEIDYIESMIRPMDNKED